MEATDAEFLEVDGTPIACRRRAGRRARRRVARRLPLRHAGHQGRRRSMPGRNATGRAPSLRHDYSGHGESGGEFRDGTHLALARRKPGRVPSASPRARRSWSAPRWAPGWRCRMVAELTARRAERPPIAGLVLIAPAPDFTSALIEPRLTGGAEARSRGTGYFEEPSAYSAEPICLHKCADRGRPPQPRDDRADRHALSGPHPAGHGRSRTCRQAHALKLASCLPADDLTVVADARRRPPAVAAAGPRHDHRRRRGAYCAGRLTRCAHRFRFLPSVAAIVGFGGTLAIILSAAAARRRQPGGDRELGHGALPGAWRSKSAWLSWRTGMPVITAWSTPGAALVAASHGFTMADAVGAFIITALLLIATGLFGPLTRLIAPAARRRRLGHAGRHCWWSSLSMRSRLCPPSRCSCCR